MDRIIFFAHPSTDIQKSLRVEEPQPQPYVFASFDNYANEYWQSGCGNKCWLPEGCYRHWKLYEKNLKKKSCLFSGCEFPTNANSGYCHNHCQYSFT